MLENVETMIDESNMICIGDKVRIENIDEEGMAETYFGGKFIPNVSEYSVKRIFGEKVDIRATDDTGYTVEMNISTLALI